MNQLILTINSLQNFNRTYNLTQINLPEIVVIGSQSSGKSSVLERIIKRDILPKGNKVATRCPVILQMINQAVKDPCLKDCEDSYESLDSDNDEIKAVFADEPDDPQYGSDRIAQRLQQMTNKISKDVEGISSRPIMLTLYSSSIPTLTLVDLPGTIKNDDELGPGASDTIRRLNEKYVQKPYAIILSVSAANVDLANSDSIQIARKFDPSGMRTLNVITKIDLMDKGTNMRDILQSKFVVKSLKTVCVVNRSQQNVVNRRLLEEVMEDERHFFMDNYRDICNEHGIEYLTACLVKKLKEQILIYLPEMKNEVAERIQEKEEKLKVLDVTKDESVLRKSVVLFVDQYSNLIRGDRDTYSELIEGGALISQVLYENFRSNIDLLMANHFTRRSIQNTIINTCGNRRMTYGIEKPFVSIVRNEIRNFEAPCLACLNRVRDLLQEFVLQIIGELGIGDLHSFVEKLEQEMLGIIQERYNITREVLKNLVKCEASDIFCAHPNSHFYESLKIRINEKKQEKREDTFNNLLNAVVECSANPPPPSAVELTKISGNLNRLNQLTLSVAVPANFTIDILNDLIGLNDVENIDTDELIPYIQNNNNFIEFINEAMKIQNEKLESIDFEAEMDIDLLECMVVEYFNQVRQNIIYSVPKWIQTLLIYDLLDEIRDGLFPFIEKDKSELMRLDPELEQKIGDLKNELVDLKKILHNLWEINR